MTIAYLGLGSNLDCPYDQLSNAIREIEALPDTSLIKMSSYYKSKPVGPQNQPDYLNAVVSIDTGLSPVQLLENLQKIETLHGRKRNIRWSARTLDIDILLFGSEVINTTRLTIPHPEMHKRAFVVQPLFEIAPALEIPGQGPLKSMLQDINTDDVQKSH